MLMILGIKQMNGLQVKVSHFYFRSIITQNMFAYKTIMRLLEVLYIILLLVMEMIYIFATNLTIIIIAIQT